MSRLAARRRDERGAVAIVVAIVATVLFLIAALVVDLGLARDVRRQAQNAADASALAAGNVLYATLEAGGCADKPCLDEAVAEAKEYARVNLGVSAGDWGACTDPGSLAYTPGGTTCISFDEATRPTLVRVRIPTQAVDTSFGTLAGVNEVPVGASARAALEDGPPDSCGLCFLGGVDAGNADFTLKGGSVHVNGDVDVGPNSVWTATDGAINVAGDAFGGQFDPDPTTGVDPITDPFAGEPMPDTTDLDSKSDPCSDGPGIYGANVDIPNNDTCALEPGLYVVTGTWSLGNNSDLTGSEVTLYAKGDGSLDFKNGDVDLSGPADDQQFVIVYDRNNTQDLSLQGNGETSITGPVYVASGTLDFNGNSCFGFSQGPVVVEGVTMANGNKSCVKVTDSQDVELPTWPGSVALDQ